MVAYITWVTASRGQLLMNPIDKFFLLVSLQKKREEKKKERNLQRNSIQVLSPAPCFGVLFDQMKAEGAVHP